MIRVPCEDYGLLNASNPGIDAHHGDTILCPVGHQGQTGTCSVFAMCSVLGSLMIRARLWDRSIPPILSKQEIIDALPVGVKGVNITKIVAHVLVHGVHLQRTYPFFGRHGLPCKSPFLWDRARFTFMGFRRLKGNDEIYAAIDNGPILGLMTCYRSFLEFSPKFKKEEELQRAYVRVRGEEEISKHMVVITGRGSLHGIDIFTIQNSFGVNWGLNGHARIQQNLVIVCYEISRPVIHVPPQD